jgi:hypothetical protein
VPGADPLRAGRGTWRALAAWAVAFGCGPREICDWEDVRDEAVCEVMTACGYDGVTSVEACVAEIGALRAEDACANDTDAAEPADACPSYSRSAARRCLAGLRWQAETCPSSFEAWTLPAACGMVCGG